MGNIIFLCILFSLILIALVSYNLIYHRKHVLVRGQFKQPIISVFRIRADVSEIKGSKSQTSFNWNCEFLIVNDRCAVLLSKKLIFFQLYKKPLVFSLDEEQNSFACRATGFVVYQQVKDEAELRVQNKRSGKNYELRLKVTDPAIKIQLQQAFENVPVINYVKPAAKKG